MSHGCGDGELPDLTEYSFSSTIHNDNVGIGISNPAGQLHVSSVRYIYQKAIDSRTRIGPCRCDTDPDVAECEKPSFATSDAIGSECLDETSAGTSWNEFKVAQTNALVVKESGYVGIGTISPQAKLQIADVYTLLNFSEVNGQSRIRPTRISPNLETDLVLSAQKNIILLPDGNGPTAFTGGGKVGIGTTAPSTALDVNGYVKSKRNLRISSSIPENRTYQRLKLTINDNRVWAHVTIKMHVGNNGGVNGSSGVGVFTVGREGSARASTISLKNSIYSGADDYLLPPEVSGNEITWGVRVRNNGTSITFSLNFDIEIVSGNPDSFVFSEVTGETAATDLRYRNYQNAGDFVNSGGNIGVGTALPESRLQVTGGGLCVGTDAACDTNNNTEGTIYAVNTTVQGADYAEYFLAEEDLEAGDIVGLNSATGLARGYKNGDKLLGVISTSSGVVGNSSIQDKQAVLVALMGQVPFNKEQVQLNDNVVSTIDNRVIGYLLASGDVYISLNSSDEVHKQNIVIDNQGREIAVLKAENQAIKMIVCELKPDAKICN